MLNLRIKASFIVFLIVASVFSIYVPSVKAETKACCEKTKNGEGCVFTDATNCDTSGRIAYTTCEQTNFCNLGCCYSSGDGSCNKNTPKAVCNSKDDATFMESPDCNIAACQKGCCLIGEESFFVTQTQCKQYGSQFPNIKVQFDSGIADERACLEKARSQEIGCCVTEDKCSFATRASCSEASQSVKQNDLSTTSQNSGTSVSDEGNAVQDNIASTDSRTTENEANEATGNVVQETSKEPFVGNKGFYKNTLCSNDKLQCGCAKQHHTECYQGRIYWYDSCGNRENIYDASKGKSYNNGFVLPIAQSCKVKNPNDPKCGNCDYSQGTLCGQAPVDVKPDNGNLVCVDLNCANVYDDKISPNAGGDKKHGESWCVYDKFPGLGKDRPGARHYRELCIAGEEMTEPCADFREQLCVQGVLGNDVLETQESFELQGGDYVEAACRKNRFEDCGKFTKKSECENVAFSDCYWMEAGIVNRTKDIESVGISGEIEVTPPGICVPLVPPGLKFWPDEEVVNLGKETPVGQESATGKAPEIDARETCGKATRECVVLFEKKPLQGKTSYECIQNCHCLKDDWKIAGYNLCSSQGDCGAKYNTFDKVSLSGLEYINEKNKNEKFTLSDIGKTAISKEGKSPREPSFFSRFDDNKGWAGLLGIASTGLISALGSGKGLSADLFKEGIFSGPMWIGSWFGKEEPNIFDTAAPMAHASNAKLNDKISLDGSQAEGSWYGGVEKQNVLPGIKEYNSFLKKNEGQSELTVTGLAVSEPEVVIRKEPTEEEVIALVKELSESKKESEIEATEKAPVARTSFKYEDLTPDLKTKVDGAGISAALWDSFVTKKETEAAKGFLEKTFGTGSALGTFSNVINTAAWLYTIYSVLDAMTTDYKTYKVSTACNPWVAPLGGKDCEKCNDEFKPCSEYKCRSLGQTCRLINPGTDEEKCINMHPNDVNSPIITANKDAITKGYNIKDAGSNVGFEILTKVDPYSPLSIGINTNEPATCKYSTNASMKLDDMPFVFGSSMFLYNQTSIVSLPRELASEEALKQTHGVYTLYIKCMDASGNKNNKDYYIKLKISPGKDLTPPIIEAASLKDNAYIAANVNEIEFSLFTNEPATCKYSGNDIEYDNMKNEFSCSQSGFNTASLFYTTYECSTTLNDLKEGNNIFYFRCSDTSGNKNQESLKFTLIGTHELAINSTMPSGEIMDNNVTLYAETSGGAESGKAVCGYQIGNMPYVEFSNTNNNIHTESLLLGSGSYNYKVICNDIAGNEALGDISFKVVKDLQAPKLMFVYKDNANLLHIELNEITSCEYSTLKPFKFGDGTKMTNDNSKIHEASIIENSEKFYITCQDEFKNEYSFIVYP